MVANSGGGGRRSLTVVRRLVRRSHSALLPEHSLLSHVRREGSEFRVGGTSHLECLLPLSLTLSLSPSLSLSLWTQDL